MFSAHVLPSHLLKIPLIFSSHLPLFLPSSLFPSYLPTKPMCIYILLQTLNLPAQIFLINLNIQIIFGKACHSQSPHFLQSPLSSFKFGPSVFFSTLFSKNISLYPSCNTRHKVLYPLKTSRITILQHVPCVRTIRRKTTYSESNCSKRSPNIIFSYVILHAIMIWYRFSQMFFSSSFQNVFLELYILILSHIFFEEIRICAVLIHLSICFSVKRFANHEACPESKDTSRVGR
jgi:hypothetical protein